MLICKKPKVFDVDVFAVAGVVGLCALTWWGVIKPLAAKTVEREQQCQESMQQKSAYRDELGRLQQISQEQRSLAARLKRTPDILQGNHGTAAVVRQLGALAQSNALRLDELTPGVEEAGEYFAVTPVTVRLSGTFPQLHGFLTDLQRKMRYVRVDSLTVSSEEKLATGTCKIALALHVFGRSQVEAGR